jgi:hypothetical protein
VIKLGDGNTGNLDAGGLHLHHFLWGILLVSAVAVFGLVDRSARVRAYMGAALGVGLGLIVDELALLVTLKDVYWSSTGWTSVAVAVALIGVIGSVLVFTRNRAHRDEDHQSNAVSGNPNPEQRLGRYVRQHDQGD